MRMDVVLQTRPSHQCILAAVMVGNSEPHCNKINSFYSLSFGLLCHVFANVSEFRSMYVPVCCNLFISVNGRGGTSAAHLMHIRLVMRLWLHVSEWEALRHNR
jgi:hypothetical protein